MRIAVPIATTGLLVLGFSGVASATTPDTSGTVTASQSSTQQSTTATVPSAASASSADVSTPTQASQSSGTGDGSQSGKGSDQGNLSVNLAIDHDVIQLGQSATLQWTTTGDVVSASASGAWSGNESFPSGTQTVTPSSLGTFTYTLTVTAKCGCKKTASVKLTVVPAPKVIEKQPIVVIIAPKCVAGHLGDVSAHGKGFDSNMTGIQSYFYTDSAHASKAVGASSDSKGDVSATVPTTGNNLGSLARGAGVFVFDTTAADKANPVRVEVNFVFDCSIVVVTPPSQQPSPSPSPVPPANVTIVNNNTNNNSNTNTNTVTNTNTQTVVVHVPATKVVQTTVNTPAPTPSGSVQVPPSTAPQFVAPSGYAHAAPTGGTGTSVWDNTGLLAGAGGVLLVLAALTGGFALRRRSRDGSEA